jgi:polyhydroxyalkanoate synthesis regulator phasin
MAGEGPKRSDPGDTFREGVRALTGILGAFKDAIEQTFDDLSKRGDLSPERARESASDAMKRVQEAIEDMRGRVDFVTRREFDALKLELSELRTQVERHAAQGGHHPHAAASAGAPPGTGGTRTGAAGSGVGDGSPGL